MSPSICTIYIEISSPSQKLPPNDFIEVPLLDYSGVERKLCQPACIKLLRMKLKVKPDFFISLFFLVY